METREPSCGTSYSALVAAERPIHHPEQVMDPSQLEVGRRYKIYNGKTLLNLIEVLEKPGEKQVKVKPVLGRGGEEMKYLADMGVTAYDSGRWNTNNYLVPEDMRV